jgi:hypothetical protein
MQRWYCIFIITHCYILFITIVSNKQKCDKSYDTQMENLVQAKGTLIWDTAYEASFELMVIWYAEET